MDDAFGNLLDLRCWVLCWLLHVAKDGMAWLHL